MESLTGYPTDRVLGELLEQVMYEPFFDTLRTKEQLGYHVSCGVRHTHGFVGFGVQIQVIKNLTLTLAYPYPNLIIIT
jgi:secreted Zn-dependent insulinase-like peptidase